MARLVFASSLFAFTLTACASSSSSDKPDPPPTSPTASPPADEASPVEASPVDDERLAKEKRLVALFREGFEMDARGDKPTPDFKAQMTAAMVDLFGDPATLPPAERRARGQQVQAELNAILARHDPELAEHMADTLAAFQCRAKQAMAKNTLRALVVAEESFRVEHDAYSADFAALGYTPPSAEYEVSIERADSSAFLARAKGTGAQAGDEWTVGESGELTQVSSACKAPKSAAERKAMTSAPTMSDEERTRLEKELTAIVRAGYDLEQAGKRPGKSHQRKMMQAMIALFGDPGSVPPSERQARGEQMMRDMVSVLERHDPELAATMGAELLSFACRSKQSEAKANLKALYVAEESFHAEFDRYSPDLDELGFRAHGQTVRYRYTLERADASSFLGRAEGIGDMAGDVWTISNDNDLVEVSGVCGKRKTSR